MKNVILVQARVSSSRLPGKVLKDINGTPMIEYLINRLAAVKTCEKVILVTSDEASDDELENLMKGKVTIVRGSLNDVLSRFCKAIDQSDFDNVVRITGDCPFVDPAIIDNIVSIHESNKNDYTSNTLKPTYPDGLDVEVVKKDVLLEVNAKDLTAFEREHVTPHIYRNTDLYKVENVAYVEDLSHLRITVDEIEDLELARIIDKKLSGLKMSFTNIITLLNNNQELREINSSFERNSGSKE
ncbi:cytidylyltransferase domain-containing protein [Acetoanaerobium sticklandii]|uniref:cytidylyltransferase domain-containing protein n=1 Tax=Acetoanaerobium sticklandii TaxID=1511 RepID=UPI003A9196C7